MGYAIAFQSVDQGTRHRFLTDQFGELLRPVAASQDRVFLVRGSRFEVRGSRFTHMPPKERMKDKDKDEKEDCCVPLLDRRRLDLHCTQQRYRRRSSSATTGSSFILHPSSFLRKSPRQVTERG